MTARKKTTESPLRRRVLAGWKRQLERAERHYQRVLKNPIKVDPEEQLKYDEWLKDFMARHTYG